MNLTLSPELRAQLWWSFTEVTQFTHPGEDPVPYVQSLMDGVDDLSEEELADLTREAQLN